jgi:hypothetical protein
MEVYPVTPDTDGVWEGLCLIGARTSLYPDGRFQDGELGDDPAAFPNIRGRRQAVRSTKHFRTEPQPGISHSAVRTRCICLQPVDEAERQLPSSCQGDASLRLRASDERSKPVIDLRPVD